MTMADAAQRTHRYLRVALVGIVIVILAGVAIESIRSGIVLPSISHYYYTPARSVFVGSLIAAALALTVLSGSDAETAFLDMAAPFAPLIALIPTAVTPASVAATAPELTFPCDATEQCLPVEAMPAVVTGATTYLLALLLILIAGLILWRQKQLQGNWVRVTMIFTLAVFLIVLGLVIPAWIDPANPGLWIYAMHYPATTVFFVAFATVPVVNIFRKTTDKEPVRWQRIVYGLVVVVLAIDVPLTAILGMILPPETHVVLICEAIALLAFATFWLVQTIQRWDERPGVMVTTPRLQPVR